MRLRTRASILIPAGAVAVAAGLVSAAPDSSGPAGVDWNTVLLAEKYAGQLVAGLGAGAGPCTNSAAVVARGSVRGLQEDFAIGLGNCLNLSDPDEAQDCFDELTEDFQDGLAEVMDQYQARLDVCALLGEAAYDPVIDPADFASPVPNPLFPLIPGTNWVYHKITDEGELEVVDVTVTSETIDILGVACTVVNDVVTLDGELIEDTDDYYVNDNLGNVWYFGELAQEFEDGLLVSLSGSFTAGVDGAKPGILMQAVPTVGQTYRQEFFLNEAEDLGTVLSTDESVTIGFGGTYDGCLQTEDFTPLEPGVREHKFYFPGIGPILEVDPDTGESLELVSFTPGV